MFTDASEEAMRQVWPILAEANNPYIEQSKEEELTKHLINQMASRLAMELVGSRPAWRKTSNYVCMEHFVLAHGRYFSGVKLSKRYRQGPVKHCYENTRMGMGHYPNLHYVEGYVVSAVIPVMHAWNIDGNGDVVDLTLRSKLIPPEDRAYFGVLFVDEFATFSHGTVIDNWRDNWPLLHDADLVARVVVPPTD